MRYVGNELSRVGFFDDFVHLLKEKQKEFKIAGQKPDYGEIISRYATQFSHLSNVFYNYFLELKELYRCNRQMKPRLLSQDLKAF